ncbi:unnamed protein product [Cuscuta campestris]|uniref:Cystatin domain-containing protein n=1 Tax=Cuscuta campestris TaxID=132261 RepID=A0A484MLX8_9ASTE|nr:unnamed protein product [Cuscuta campestris]
MMVPPSVGSSSSPSGTMKRRLNDGVACSLLVEDKGVMNLEEEEEYMDEDEDEDDEESIRIFQVADDVWESKSFSKWRKPNWACFYHEKMDDYFERLPKEYFKPGEDPRSEITYELKMGHTLCDYMKNFPCGKAAIHGARLAIEFFNRENKNGKTLEYKSLSRVRIGSRCFAPSGFVYFLTIVAIENDSGVEREFQASLFRPNPDMKIWYLRALREKPYVF